MKNKWADTKHCNMDPETLNQETLKTIEKICPPWVPSDPKWLPKCSSNIFLDRLFDFKEFNYVINNCKQKSSSGLDKIEYICISRLPTKFK